MTKKQTKIVERPQAATVRIDTNISAKLKRLAKRYDLTQGEVIGKMLDFFEATGYQIDDTEAAGATARKLAKSVTEAVTKATAEIKEMKRQWQEQTAEMSKNIVTRLDDTKKSVDENTTKVTSKLERSRSSVWQGVTRFEKSSAAILQTMGQIRDDIHGSASLQRQVSDDTAKALANVSAHLAKDKDLPEVQPQAVQPTKPKERPKPIRMGNIIRVGEDIYNFVKADWGRNGQTWRSLTLRHNGQILTFELNPICSNIEEAIQQLYDKEDI